VTGIDVLDPSTGEVTFTKVVHFAAAPGSPG